MPLSVNRIAFTRHSGPVSISSGAPFFFWKKNVFVIFDGKTKRWKAEILTFLNICWRKIFLVENFDRRFDYSLEYSTDFGDVLNGGNFRN